MEKIRHYRRFGKFHRFTHILVVISFLGLALTGLPLRYSETGWGEALCVLLGGPFTARVFHRIFAIMTFLYFFLHLGFVAKKFLKEGRALFWGPDSLVPQPRDAVELYRHFCFFLGMGPRPRFGRWTYWEKFDYWAVFWGVAIIGSSGLVLWFPGFFTQIFPGWILNVAAIVHSDEALLAVAFIFSVHFFNGHLRPEKFPMDTVIFTGSLSEEELRTERPAQYEALKKSGRLDALAVSAPSRGLRLASSLFGGVALLIGLSLIFLILLASLN